MKPPRPLTPLTGKVIPVYRPVYGTVAAAVIGLGALLAFGGAGVTCGELVEGSVLLAGLGLVMSLAGVALWVFAHYLRTHVPHLVIGDDRVQFWQGTGQPVEVL